MRNFLAALASLILLLSSTTGEAKLALSKYPKVYRGDEGVKVTFAPITGAKKQALIEVTGIDTVLDGKVFLYEQQNQGRAEAYVMQYDGSEVTRLRVEQGYWSRGLSLYLPDHKGEIFLSFDEKLSAKVKLDALSKRYEKDKTLQAKMAKFDRPKREAQLKEQMVENTTAFTKDCGGAITINVDWKNISDEILKKYSVSSFCAAPVDSMSYHCRASEENKKAVAGKVETVNCSFGPKLKVSLAGKAINLVVEPETPNQDDFMSAFVKNSF